MRRYTKKSEYAALAVLELAKARRARKPTSAQKIASKYGFSVLFLMRILQILHKADLVETVRGSNGGFRLIPEPEELTVGYVVSLVEQDDDSTPKVSESSKKLNREPNEEAKRSLDKMSAIWNRAEAVRQEFLNGVLYSDLLRDDDERQTLSFSI